MPMPEIILLESLGMSITLRVRKRMPSPLALSTQWHTFPIIFRESLQTCGINGKRKLTIANRE